MASTEIRASLKPNAVGRARYRMALQGRACVTCLLPVAWDMAQGNRHAGSADLGHRIALEVCREYSPSVIGVQCHACNEDAKNAGIVDQSAAWVSAPYSLPPIKVAQAWRQCFVPQSADDLPSWGDRRVARIARGIGW